MTARLSTHVLDTGAGRPAAGVVVTLHRVDVDGHSGELLTRTTTNADGRTDEPLLQGARFTPGVYELCFAVGDYFAVDPTGPGTNGFLDVVPVRFGASGQENLHVPLLVTPWSYSTYRGS